MSWQELSDAVDHSDVAALLLRASSANSRIYWYPGAGSDLTPLLLLPPGNNFKKQVLRSTGAPVDGAMLLWMTDTRDLASMTEEMTSPSYPELWDRYNATFFVDDIIPFTIAGDHLSYNLAKVVIQRSGCSEVYSLISATGDALAQTQTFNRFNLSLEWIALIKVGGFAGNLTEAIPSHLSKSQNRRLLPDAYIGDRDWNCQRTIDGYRRLYGGGVKGWGFSDPGCASIWPREDLVSFYNAMLPAGERISGPNGASVFAPTDPQ